MLKKRFRLFIITLFPTIASASTLQAVVLHALNDNPRVLAQHYAVQAEKYQVGQAFGQYWPMIDLTASIGPEHVSSPTTREDGSSASGLIRREAGINIRQILYSGSSRYYLLHQRKAGYLESQKRLNEINELIALEVTEAYLNLLRRRAIVDVYHQNIRSHQEMLKRVSTRSTAGAGRISEVQLSKSRLARAQSRLKDAQAQLHDAENTYQRFTGLLPPSAMTLPQMPQLKPQSAKQVWAIARRDSPIIHATYWQLQAAKAAVGLAKAPFRPSITLELNAIHANNVDGVRGDNNRLQALIVGRYNLFAGDSDWKQLKTEKARAHQRYYNLQDTLRTVRNETFTVWDFLKRDGEQTAALLEHQNQAEQVWHSYREEFNLGHRNLFDLLNAETEYYNAKISYINARYSWMLDHYRLLAVMGHLVHYFS